MNWYLGNNWYLLLLLVLPLLAWIIVKYLGWKKNKRKLFAESKFHQNLFEKNTSFSKFFPVLYILAVFFLVLSIIDILSGSEKIKSVQKMNNVMFVMDVSNSMNAEDIDPDRLTQAKNIIINTIKELKNDKIGIVIFAGEAVSVMPLTTDYNSVETYISDLQTDNITIQGTDFLKAMEVTVSKFKNISKGSRKVVLISDGEDNEGNDNAAIRLANSEGISITSVGIGTDEGAPVPVYEFGQLEGYKLDANGETVISKRQTEALKKMAASTGGNYIDGNNMKDAPKRIAEELSKKMSSTDTEVNSRNANHYYQYSLAVSILIFMIIFIFNPKRDFNI
ncbi:vWA domain-containing protein [Chryseobacterium oryzae]|uniref:VWA domain-containing protein n=1 Tax=Chryseobacterium oryzae TaxID=2929799 RepID=A0ABY4BL77_9FLAO|nr:VWA domain-containing protein [Chryseobacterium oryzae]UOE39002.1 VWA domain-containing protein [Chryseobacterium oryzae]